VQKGRGAVRPASLIRCKHARARRSSWSTTHACAHALVTRTPPQTHQAPNHTHGAREGAQRALLRGGDTVPECTVCQAATTGGVPAKYSFQPSIPYALTMRFYINPTVSETGQFPVTLLRKILWDVCGHLLLAGGLNRPHSASQNICCWRMA